MACENSVFIYRKLEPVFIFMVPNLRMSNDEETIFSAGEKQFVVQALKSLQQNQPLS